MLSVTTGLISCSLHFWCHERCSARGSAGCTWLMGELLHHVHTSDHCLGLHKDLLPVIRHEEQRGQSLWQAVWMQTWVLAAEVWAPGTAQVLTRKVSQLSPPHTEAPLRLQKPDAAPHPSLAKGLLLPPWCEALRKSIRTSWRDLMWISSHHCRATDKADSKQRHKHTAHEKQTLPSVSLPSGCLSVFEKKHRMDT